MIPANAHVFAAENTKTSPRMSKSIRSSSKSSCNLPDYELCGGTEKVPACLLMNFVMSSYYMLLSPYLPTFTVFNHVWSCTSPFANNRDKISSFVCRDMMIITFFSWDARNLILFLTIPMGSGWWGKKQILLIAWGLSEWLFISHFAPINWLTN